MKEGKPRHYHHHMEEATGEPVESYKVVCERCQKALGNVPDGFLRGLKFVMCRDCFGAGEPYPEELDPDAFNRLAHRVAQALLEQDRAFETYLGAVEKDKPKRRAEWSRALRKQQAALGEYEKMVSGE